MTQKCFYFQFYVSIELLLLNPVNFSKLVLWAQILLIWYVEAHLRYIWLPYEFHFHIISQVKLLQIFDMNHGYPNFRLSDEGLNGFEMRSNFGWWMLNRCRIGAAVAKRVIIVNRVNGLLVMVSRIGSFDNIIYKLSWADSM